MGCLMRLKIKSMKLKIKLEAMRFYAYHGVLEQERKVGNNYQLELTATLNAYRSLTSDELSDTINYAEVYSLVQREMETPSRLLEHVVGRIAGCVFDAFPMIAELELTLAKVKPPFNADISSASVSLLVQRGEL